MTFGRRQLRLLVLMASLLSGCASSGAIRDILGVPPPATPGPPEETRWVLVANPRFGATMAEPEYIWVEEGRIPGSVTTFLFGKNAVVAPPHLVPQYGPPPGNGQVSPVQGGASLAPRGETSPPAAPRHLLTSEARPAEQPAPPGPSTHAAARESRAPETTPRGYIVHIQAGLIVVDLTSGDGIKPGSLLSLRRERVPLIHPVTKEPLGELDEEVGTARVVEIRERFSVAEIQETRPGFEPKVRDRVVVKQR